jgi:hypothetical protein
MYTCTLGWMGTTPSRVPDQRVLLYLFMLDVPSKILVEGFHVLGIRTKQLPGELKDVMLRTASTQGLGQLLNLWVYLDDQIYPRVPKDLPFHDPRLYYVASFASDPNLSHGLSGRPVGLSGSSVSISPPYRV